ncbi:MAG TPA: endonuclease/exonuclease/phosphatase family protein [Caulobacter sp.]|nr:endonuclease/exonuclease/phosphatase family protein [Caulobacter sp.]
MTYNVHRCVGVDRKLNVERVAEVIAACRPDIVALQELDVGRARTRGVDQAHRLAELLQMRAHFNAALTVEEERYGDAILTALPERLVKVGPLPGLPRLRGLEPRGALWVAVDLDGRELQVINTHLGLVPREQQVQVAELLGRRWMGAEGFESPAVLLGDFNATPFSQTYRMLTAVLRDAQDGGPKAATATFPSGFPMLRIDHVFVSSEIRVRRVESPFDPRARAASDHLPLVVEIEVPAARAEQSATAGP